MGGRGLGWALVAAGLGLAAVGFLLARGWLGWFGRLPGDIRIASETTRVYIPVTSMLLVSAVLTIVMNLLRRL